MARRALLVGINDFKGIQDLRGCLNDVKNMRDVLKTYLGFRNEDIRVLVDSRATRDNILYRLESMVNSAQSGDILVFHFSGHGSQIRDRDGDELLDHMDELLCPYDMNWDGAFILDDDLDRIFKSVPGDISLEVFLDCCHSGTGSRDVSFGRPPELGPENPSMPRFLHPPMDIMCRAEGEEERLSPTRGFTSQNRSGSRSTSRHVLWAGCHAHQTSADAFFEGDYHGAFTYHFCTHMRAHRGNISRGRLIDKIRDSLRNQHYSQIPQLECGDDAAMNNRPLQFTTLGEDERLLFLTKPNMQGGDVREVQEALAGAGFDIDPDGVFGPYTRVVVIKFQEKKGLLADGVVGPSVRRALFA